MAAAVWLPAIAARVGLESLEFFGMLGVMTSGRRDKQLEQTGLLARVVGLGIAADRFLDIRRFDSEMTVHYLDELGGDDH